MSERRFPETVAVRDRRSGRYLAHGANWTDDPSAALVVDGRAAADVVRRFACEPHALEVVAIADGCRAVA